MTADPTTGRRRHQTPNEAWATAVANGFSPVVITPDVSRDLFRPRRECTVRRGEVVLWKNRYFSRELQEFHGEVVQVGYDIHNANSVLVFTQDGRLICEAEFEANNAHYFPVPFIEQKQMERDAGRQRRHAIKGRQIEADAQRREIEIADAQLQIAADASPTFTLISAAEPEPAAVPVRVAGRPLFFVDSEKYRWLQNNQSEWTDADRAWLDEFTQSDLYHDLAERFEAEGIAWGKYSKQA